MAAPLDAEIQSIAWSIESMIRQLLAINFLASQKKADQPYSESFRVKVRTWQMLLVCL